MGISIVGDNIKLQRKQQGLSIIELAQIANMNKASINRYETGRRSPKVSDLERLAAALGCTLDELVCAETPRKEA